MYMIDSAIGLGIALALVALYLLTCIRVLNEYERGVVFRLGRAMPKSKGPGLIMVFWPVDSMMRVDLRTITKVIEPQDIITRDNVSVRSMPYCISGLWIRCGPFWRWPISCSLRPRWP